MGHEDLLIPVRTYAARPGVFRWPDEMAFAPAEPAVRIVHGKSAAPGAADGPCREAYRLTIAPGGVQIIADDEAGAYYAVETLRDLLALHGRELPCCIIDDWPDLPRRGAYLDCSRGKVPTAATLKALVKRLARWKINELQLYVENVFTFRRHPAIGAGYDPFTPGELLGVQAHCKLHHVRLVGSLASFGHMEKILALPAYRDLGEMPGFGGHPGGTTLCPIDERSIRLVAELYEEFLPLFEAGDFNACCDETWELGKGRSRAAADSAGVGRVYLEFLLKLRELCRRHGKRMNVWADIVLEHPELMGEVPRDVVMLNWDYNAGGRRMARTGEIAAAGLPFLVCPGTSSWQTHGTRLANAMGNVAEAARLARQHGAEGLLNTDWGDCGHRNLLGASLHGLAHGAAHAWNGAAVDDATFTERFCHVTFGDPSTGSGHAAGPLAELLRVLGRSYVTCGAPHGNECALYHALVEPLAGPRAGERSRIDSITEDGARQVLADLGSVGPPQSEPGPDGSSLLGAVPPAQEPSFESLALEELSLAARMDIAACRRTLLAKALRRGESPPAADLHAHADELAAVGADLERLWLARNKRSRLDDNLSLLRQAREDARGPAG